MADQTRTFLAIALPEPTRLALEQLQQSLRGELPGLRWSPPGQLHLTLAFLGDVPTADLEALGEGVAGAIADRPRFDLAVAGLGAFPNARRARVLWAGVVGEALPHLEELQRAVVRATKKAGHPPSDNRFHPHVTLGRSKGDRGPSPDLSPICDRHRGWAAGPMPVEAVELVASELTPRGSIYTVLRSSPLLGAALRLDSDGSGAVE